MGLGPRVLVVRDAADGGSGPGRQGVRSLRLALHYMAPVTMREIRKDRHYHGLQEA